MMVKSHETHTTQNIISSQEFPMKTHLRVKGDAAPQLLQDSAVEFFKTGIWASPYT